ncbi:uncharacterized protein LOC130625051 [Hydractinia symbiolongicarpus]|uniref:uncharacterized protein LOC130625051 n=1 Tax=Hydractinia symbiolongicarpus TaxID=13093 RepID=UPI002550642A|nr:uncharacterized protein LOC130625051 [Hydractinia symbiolongicarpus]
MYMIRDITNMYCHLMKLKKRVEKEVKTTTKLYSYVVEIKNVTEKINQKMKETCGQKWCRQRRNTEVVCNFIAFLTGLDYGVVISTLVLYLKDLVQVDNPNLYYAIVIGTFSLSSILVGTIGGHIVDQTRNLKMFTNLVLLLMLIGNLLYVIYLHPAFLIIGRFLAGFGDSFFSGSAGELVRLHNRKDATKAIWIISAAFAIGFISGPAFAVIFKGINFKIGSLVVNYLNFVGVFIAGLSFILIFSSNILLPDEPLDLNFVEKTEPEDDQNDSSYHKGENSKPARIEMENLNVVKTLATKQVISLLLTDKDVLLIYITSLISMYSNFGLDIVLPLIVYELLEWSQLALTVILIISSLTFFAMLCVFSKFCTTDRREYHAFLICTCCSLICLVVILEFNVLTRSFRRDVLLITVFVICYSVVWFPEQVFMKSIIAKIVPPSIQSFTQGSRSAISRFSGIISAITTPLLMPWIHIWAFVLIIMVTCNLVCLVIRGKSLTNIKVISRKK